MVTDKWRAVLKMEQKKQVVESTISEVNRGGVVITVGGLRGFMPFSRLDPSRTNSVWKAESSLVGFMDEKQVAQLSAELVGQPIRAMIIQVHLHRQRSNITPSPPPPPRGRGGGGGGGRRVLSASILLSRP